MISTSTLVISILGAWLFFVLLGLLVYALDAILERSKRAAAALATLLGFIGMGA